MISRDDIALTIVRFLERKILVDPAATTTCDEVAIVLVSPLRKCADRIVEAAILIDAACFAAGLPLLGTFRVRRAGGALDVGGLPSAAWRERCGELQRRDELHGWDAADFSQLRARLHRLAGLSPRDAWERTLRAHGDGALAHALRAGRPSEPGSAPISPGFGAERKPPTWHVWRF